MLNVQGRLWYQSAKLNSPFYPVYCPSAYMHVVMKLPALSSRCVDLALKKGSEVGQTDLYIGQS